MLVGINTGDDCAVYQITDDLAIIQTVDYFTPIVDDPYDYGAIAVANALSDVYAMGAKPLFALNVVGFHTRGMPLEILIRMMKGGGDKAREAGVEIVGGHTIDDKEPKYGLAVTGVTRGVCRGCNMNIPPQMFNQLLKEEELLSCPTCNRMMYHLPEVEER